MMLLQKFILETIAVLLAMFLTLITSLYTVPVMMWIQFNVFCTLVKGWMVGILVKYDKDINPKND